jgi:hypothetical protein
MNENKINTATHIAKRTTLSLKYPFGNNKNLKYPFAIKINNILWDLNSFRPDFRDDKEFINFFDTSDDTVEGITVFEILSYEDVEGNFFIPRIIVWGDKKFINVR